MKKLLLWSLVIMVCISMIATFSLIGCKKAAPAEEEVAEEEVEEKAAPAEEEVEEKIMIIATTMAGNDVVSEQYALAFEKANKNPNLSFDWAPIEYAQLHDKIVLNEAAAAGEFDLHFLITDWLAELIPAGFLTPLNDYLESSPIDGWSEDESLSTIEKFEKVFPPGASRLQTVDGKIYGIPAHDGPMNLFYRTDLFNDETEKENFEAEYGYELKAPDTWEQFKDIADFFTRPDENLWGTAFAGNDPQATPYDFVQIAHNYGAEYFNANGEPNFNGQEWITALEFLETMYEENSPPGAESVDMLGRADQFKEGIVAMYIDWMAWAGYFELPDISKVVGNVGYTFMPQGSDNRDSLDIYWIFAISGSSPNPDMAWEVMKTFASIEGDKAVVMETQGQQMPVRYTTMNDPDVVEAFPYYELMKEILDAGYTFGSPYHPANAQIFDQLRIAVQRYLAGEGAAEEILNDANAAIADAMAEFE